MKNIYFIRHAESVANASNIHQGPDVPLSESGLLQASSVADRFTKIDIEKIIASDMVRAEGTARVIGEKTGKEIILSPLFREQRRPTAIWGLHADGIKAKEINKAIAEHFDDLAWHYSDEENFFDARTRAREAISFLEKEPESSFCVITHGTFLRFLVAVMLDGEISPHEFLRLHAFLIAKNTGITWCQKGHPKAVDQNIWQMVTWSDHAHLG